MQTQRLWLAWASVFSSLVIYGVMPLFIPPLGTEPREPQVILVGGLIFIGLVEGIATVAIRHIALVRPIRSGALDLESKSGAMRFFNISITNWVLSSSIGIYGLVLFFLYGVPELFYPFLAVAMLLLFYHAPRVASLKPAASPTDLARPDVKIG